MHLITNFEARGGAETMLARLLRAFPGNPALVVSLKTVSEQNIALAANADVKYHSLEAHSVRDLAFALGRLRSLIRRYEPEEILCWMYHAMVLGSVAAGRSTKSIPVYWNVRQALDDRSALSRSTRIANRAAAYLSKRCEGIIFNSERARTQHIEYGYDARNTTVIPNGFDLPPATEIVPHQPRVFGIAARFHQQKDFPNFFEAAAKLRKRLPDARFVAAGRDLTPDNPVVMELIGKAGLPPECLDLRGQIENMANFYREIDVLVLSSRTEGFPNVVAEAMSFARPAISTDVGDAAQIIGRTGFVVPRQDSGALADAMWIMAKMSAKEYAAKMQAARKRIKANYELGKIATQYEQFLRGGEISEKLSTAVGRCK